MDSTSADPQTLPMALVNPGRRGADIEGDFVVFLIGARLERMHPIRSLRDLGGMRGMPYMLKYLTNHPDKGLLGYETYGLTMNVQYWRSFEHLERFARDDSDPHLKTWRNYWKRVGTDPRSGIWHETYLVRAGEYEAIYGNMPAHGLAKASRGVAIGTDSSARGRLKRLTGVENVRGQAPHDRQASTRAEGTEGGLTTFNPRNRKHSHGRCGDVGSRPSLVATN